MSNLLEHSRSKMKLRSLGVLCCLKIIGAGSSVSSESASGPSLYRQTLLKFFQRTVPATVEATRLTTEGACCHLSTLSLLWSQSFQTAQVFRWLGQTPESSTSLAQNLKAVPSLPLPPPQPQRGRVSSWFTWTFWESP